MTEEYIRAHMQRGRYQADPSLPHRFQNLRGWQDYAIGRSMIFSHRDNAYTKESFTEGLHSHLYYEVILYLSGEVEYIRGNTLIRPNPYSVIWFKPGESHTARLREASRYERYVMYFSPDFFELDGAPIPMTGFMERDGVFALNTHENSIADFSTLMQKTEQHLASHQPFAQLIAKSCLTEFFGLLNGKHQKAADGYAMHDSMSEVKRYIDLEYASIRSTEELAERFFYSREHLSRKFKSRFNISVYDYLTQRRITESLPLLLKNSVADASYAVGFHSQSAYIAAFVKQVGCLPSEYKKANTTFLP